MERLMTALLELTLPMALVIAVLLAAGPLLGRRFTAKWRYWAWLLIAVRLLLPVGIAPCQTEHHCRDQRDTHGLFHCNSPISCQFVPHCGIHFHNT